MGKVQALRHVSLLWLFSLAGAGCAFLTQMVLAHHLAPAEYGEFASALSTVSILAPLAGFGIQGLWLQSFGQEGLAAKKWLGSSFLFIAISIASLTLVVLIWAQYGPHDPGAGRLLFWLSPYIAGQAMVELTIGKLQIEERYVALSLWQFLPHLLRLIGVTIAFYVLSSDLVSAAAFIYLGVSLFFLFAGVKQLRQMNGSKFALGLSMGVITDAPKKINVISVVVRSWPYGLAGAFYLIYFQSAIVLLSYLSGGEAAGIYNIAFGVMSAIYLFPLVLYQKFLLPKIHRWTHHNAQKLLTVLRIGNIWMAALGILGGIFLYLLSPYIVALLFGNKYSAASDVLKIMAFCVPLRFISTSMGSFLVKDRDMKLKVKIMGFAAVLNIFVNLVLIPRYSYLGSAIATVVTEFLLLFGLHMAVKIRVLNFDGR